MATRNGLKTSTAVFMALLPAMTVGYKYINGLLQDLWNWSFLGYQLTIPPGWKNFCHMNMKIRFKKPQWCSRNHFMSLFVYSEPLEMLTTTNINLTSQRHRALCAVRVGSLMCFPFKQSHLLRSFWLKKSKTHLQTYCLTSYTLHLQWIKDVLSRTCS